MVTRNNIRKSIKILFLTLNPNLQGPLPKHNPLLIEALKNLGCQVTRSTWGRHSENENILQKIFGRLEDIWKALVELARMKPDIIYVATTLDEQALVRDIPLLLATCWSPAKIVLKMHGSKTNQLADQGHILYKLFARLLVLLSDAILLLSSEELETWKKFESRGKYYRVDNPFIPSRGTKSGELTSIIQRINSHPILLFAGRLIKAKGIFDLLHAMPAILRQVECYLLIAGDGEEKKEIENFIEKADLKQHVSLLGYVASDRLSGFYKSSSIFVLPTYFGEGFPTVIAEAMSFGLPIITTPIRGARDHLKDGINALFVQPRNPDAIVGEVVRLLNEPELCLKMSHANLKKVQEFKPENVVPRYIQIFQELLSEDVISK